MHPSELNDSVTNDLLVGVTTSVKEETEDSNTGTDVNGQSGDCGGAEVTGDGILELYSFDPTINSPINCPIANTYGEYMQLEDSDQEGC